MIYTLTLSPSNDLVIEEAPFELSLVNRYQKSTLLPGGKGLNASIVMKRHGFDNQAITFFDNNSLGQYKTLFEDEKLTVINFESEDRTRINIKFYSEKHFELNGPKTILSSKNKLELLNFIQKLKTNDFLMIMGTGDEELILEILSILKENKVDFLLDVDSKRIMEFISYSPFIIKPNRDELKDNFNIVIDNNLEEVQKQLQALKIRNCIISLDKDGSYLFTENGEIYKASILKPIKVVSATGAGDSMISSFVAHYLKTKDYSKSLKFASAVAMGTVTSTWLGTLEKTNIFLSNIQIKKIK